MPYMFSDCPTTPPPYLAQRPPHANWCKHKSVLCTTSLEAMGSVMFCDTSTIRKFHEQDLESSVTHILFDVDYSIGSNIREIVLSEWRENSSNGGGECSCRFRKFPADRYHIYCLVFCISACIWQLQRDYCAHTVCILVLGPSYPFSFCHPLRFSR